MKLLSSTTIYAIRALIFLLKQDSTTRYTHIREISQELGISFHFLTKILQSLTQAELLISYRGPSGGVAFRKDPKDIRLLDLIDVLEGPDYFTKCMLGLPGCGSAEPCPVHDMWTAFKEDFKIKFASTTLQDLKNLGGRITLEQII